MVRPSTGSRPIWTTWNRLLESGPLRARPDIVRTLGHWRQDADLAGIRDPEGLAKLPEPERREWQTLWAEVDSRLKKAQGQAP